MVPFFIRILKVYFVNQVNQKIVFDLQAGYHDSTEAFKSTFRTDSSVSDSVLMSS